MFFLKRKQVCSICRVLPRACMEMSAGGNHPSPEVADGMSFCGCLGAHRGRCHVSSAVAKDCTFVLNLGNRRALPEDTAVSDSGIRNTRIESIALLFFRTPGQDATASESSLCRWNSMPAVHREQECVWTSEPEQYLQKRTPQTNLHLAESVFHRANSALWVDESETDYSRMLLYESYTNPFRDG